MNIKFWKRAATVTTICWVGFWGVLMLGELEDVAQRAKSNMENYQVAKDACLHAHALKSASKPASKPAWLPPETDPAVDAIVKSTTPYTNWQPNMRLSGPEPKKSEEVSELDPDKFICETSGYWKDGQLKEGPSDYAVWEQERAGLSFLAITVALIWAAFAMVQWLIVGRL